MKRLHVHVFQLLVNGTVVLLLGGCVHKPVNAAVTPIQQDKKSPSKQSVLLQEVRTEANNLRAELAALKILMAKQSGELRTLREQAKSIQQREQGQGNELQKIRSELLSLNDERNKLLQRNAELEGQMANMPNAVKFVSEIQALRRSFQKIINSVNSLSSDIKFIKQEMQSRSEILEPKQTKSKPQQSELKPQQAKVKAQQTKSKPQQLESKPQQAKVKAQQTKVKPQQLESKPQKSQVKSQETNVKPQKPGSKPQKPEVKAQQTKLNSKQTELQKKPQQPELSPQQPEIQPKQTKLNPFNPVRSSSGKQIPNDKGQIIIQYGDTLWGLASNYHVSVKELREWNGLGSNQIMIGYPLQVVAPAQFQASHTESPSVDIPAALPKVDLPKLKVVDTAEDETDTHVKESTEKSHILSIGGPHTDSPPESP